jgi:hypothetical protein
MQHVLRWPSNSVTLDCGTADSTVDRETEANQNFITIRRAFDIVLCFYCMSQFEITVRGRLAL